MECNRLHPPEGRIALKVCLQQLPDALEFAEKSLDLRFPGGTTWVASRFDDGKLAGVAVFTPVIQGNSSLHVASSSAVWFSPDFCRAMFHHGFCALSCSRLTATVLSGNTRCRKLTEKVGFLLEGTLRGFSFGDLALYGMLKGECKWVESSIL